MSPSPQTPFIDEIAEINKRKKNYLSTRLTLWFFVLAMLPMLLVAWISYYQANKSLSDAAVRELHQSTALNVKFIQNWFEYRLMDVNSQVEVTGYQVLLNSLSEGFKEYGGTLENYAKSPEWKLRVKGKQGELAAFSDSYDYIDDIFLVDPNGNVLYSVERERYLGTNLSNGAYAETLFSEMVKTSLKEGRILFSDIERYGQTDAELGLFLSAPLVSNSLKNVGVLVIKVNLDRIMNGLETANLAQHEVHYLIGKDGLLRTTLEGDKQDIIVRSIQTKPFLDWKLKKFESTPSDKWETESGFAQSGINEYLDPNGYEVFGLHHTVKIHNLEWLLISEVRKSFALGAADWLGNIIITLVVITGVLVSILAIIQSRRITRPIENLAKATMALAAGEKDQYVNVESNDEIGRLAEAFNHMLVMRHTQEIALEQSHQESKQALTQLEKQSSKLLVARDDAEAAVRAKADFLASMSHEIRTPMNGVLGMMSLLLNSSLNKEQHHQVTLARSSATSLLSVINDILDFSKIEAGKLEIESVDFDLRAMLGEFSEAISHRSCEGEVELIVDATDVEYTLVKGDSSRLRQVLSNLVGNSLKFTSKGEIVVRIAIENENENENENELRLLCSVTDTGIGIPKDKIDYLFDSFTQADSSTTRKYGGSGLGLAIVKQLCEMMGGSIKASSEEGVGSCFEFNVLLQTSAESKKVMPSMDINDLSILVVDDNTTHRDMLEKQLTRWGATVEKAASTQQALRTMVNKLDNEQEPTFDAVFINQCMPYENGFVLAKAIRNDNRFSACQLVMMTPMAERGSVQLFAEKGFSAYFPKPTTTTDLFDALAMICDDSQNMVSRGNLDEMPEKIVWPANTKILMVEDNLVNQTVAVALLELIGLSCDIADNGAFALEMLNKTTPENAYDLILMDCQMPEMDGYEASRQIRKGHGGDYYKDIGIIAMTANAMKGDQEKCLNAGMSDYLSKPIDTEILEKKLYLWLVTNRSVESEKGPPELESVAQERKSLVVQPEVSAESPVFEELVIWDQNAALKRMLGKEKILKVLLTTFFSDTPQYVALLFERLEQSDYSAAAQSAHAIKGVAANLSALALADCASGLERSCLDEKLEDIDIYKLKFQPIYDDAANAFKLYLESLA